MYAENPGLLPLHNTEKYMQGCYSFTLRLVDIVWVASIRPRVSRRNGAIRHAYVFRRRVSPPDVRRAVPGPNKRERQHFSSFIG